MSTRQTREAIVALLSTVEAGQPRGLSTTETYVHSLNAPDQVRSGKFAHPPANIVPFACVWCVQVDEDLGPPMASREQRGTFTVLAWVDANPKDPEDRQNQAEDLLDDMRAALRASPRLQDTCLGFTASGGAWEDERDQTTGPASFGVVMLVIVATWRER